MNNPISITFLVLCLGTGFLLLLIFRRKKQKVHEKLEEAFPAAWRDLLIKRVRFYGNLDAEEKQVFEKRVQLFIASKQIEGVETEVDDAVRLMVASSAVIPTFAFPEYNYPQVETVLLYPNSFDEGLQTERYDGHKQNITGMVHGAYHNRTVILSKPDLMKDFDGLAHKENVGIHEFVHMLDKEDGEIDGVPERLIEHRFVAPWLREIKSEIKRVEAGKSDINPYALTNNAEFLAVVSEYFFGNPEKFQRKHPELYQFLLSVFHVGTKG